MKVQTVPLVPAYPVKDGLREKLRLYLKPGPAHFLMYTAGRFAPVRGAVVGFRSLRSPRPNRGVIAPRDLYPVNISYACNLLKRNGVYDCLQLREETVKELLHYCTTADCFGEGLREYPFIVSTKKYVEAEAGVKFGVGRYLDCRRDCAAVQRLESDPSILALARAYFGTEPVLVGARMWWSYASELSPEQEAKNGQTFHYDIDGYRSLSFFFYLTDADEESGAHTYIRGSHRRKKLRHLLSLYKSKSEEELRKVYREDDFCVVTGPPGLGFAEDTFGFHKGLRPRSRDRLLLQLRFGLRSYGGDEAE